MKTVKDLICSGFPSFSFQLVYSIHFLLCARRSVRKFCLLFYCIRSLTEFPKILAIAVDSLLCSCDDQESDVRLVAGESLNKLIKVHVHQSRREIGYELFWACKLHVLQVFENEIYYTYSLKINTPKKTECIDIASFSSVNSVSYRKVQSGLTYVKHQTVDKAYCHIAKTRANLVHIHHLAREHFKCYYESYLNC